MLRPSLTRFLLLSLTLCLLPSVGGSRSASEKPAASAAPAAVPATRFYPIAVGNKWELGFRRATSFTMAPVEGEERTFNTSSEGTQSSEIVRRDEERTGESGPVFVQKVTETTTRSTDPDGATDETAKGPRLVVENYFRVNERGIWVISTGEPDEKGESVESVKDRRLPLLWLPPDLKPGRKWIVTCQIDADITARIAARVGQPQTVRVNGRSYEGCLPVISIAEQMEGRLDVGIGLAPIRSGRIVDLTWYAPGVGVVRAHQSANFVLEPPNQAFSEARAHFEETQELQPGFTVSEG